MTLLTRDSVLAVQQARDCTYAHGRGGATTAAGGQLSVGESGSSTLRGVGDRELQEQRERPAPDRA